MTAALSPSYLTPVAPAPAPVPAAPAAPAAQQPFAQMLSRTQEAARASVQASAQAGEAQPDPADALPACDEAARPAAAPQRPQAAKADRADKPRPVEKSARPDGESPDPAADAAESAKGDEHDAAPTAPAHADWLAGLQLPPAPDAARAQDPGLTDARGLQAAAGLKPEGAQFAGSGKGEHTGPARHDALAPDVAGKITAGGQAALERAELPVPAQAAQEVAQLDASPTERFSDHLNLMGASLHTAPAARTPEPAATVTVAMPTPATAPEFAQSLGVQVSVLARDGIQQAELHLNPAEMGPISVQIALDGSQAQVNFGADSAATRQIIESGLPELAAALRDAGFTLSGGGVHSQARGRGEGQGEGASPGGSLARNGGAAGSDEATVRRVVARVSAGGVDLYA